MFERIPAPANRRRLPREPNPADIGTVLLSREAGGDCRLIKLPRLESFKLMRLSLAEGTSCLPPRLSKAIGLIGIRAGFWKNSS
jgi:hypothetical protein